MCRCVLGVCVLWKGVCAGVLILACKWMSSGKGFVDRIPLIPQGNDLSNCSERKQTLHLNKLGTVPISPAVPDENVLKVKGMSKKKVLVT